MLRLTAFEFIVRIIPEAFLIILIMIAISNTKFNAKRYIISSLLFGLYIYIVRMLPINYGVHTILDIFIMIIIMSNINKTDIILAIKSSIITTIVLFICEGINVLVLSFIFKDRLDIIMSNMILKTMYGLPSLMCFAIITIIYYLRKKRCLDMFKIENICEKISSYIAQELKLDDDKKSIINYGIFGFIQMGICIALVIIFGFIFNVTIEALIVSFTISILRKSSGGVHANSPGRCAVIGTISTIGMALICKYIDIRFDVAILLGGVIFIWSYYTIYKLAPVDSIAKPIKSIEKRKRLKKSSIIILSIYLIIVLINISCYLVIKNPNLLTYLLCIYMGLLWQTFSLTEGGHLILGNLG